MKKRRLANLAAFALPLLFSVAGCASCEKPAPAGQKAQPAVWVGRISLKGNEPHTWLALSTEDGTVYELIGERAAVIRDRHQNRRLRVEGKVVSAAKGPGFPARIEVGAFSEVQ